MQLGLKRGKRSLFIVRQLLDHPDTENHGQQTYRDYHKQAESEPTEYHG